ncbi:MAG: hypothetical protein H6650_13935 [Ardenticatenales bacterium]|nr:hypothetical protein [Ardenticatenales bacterium]
MKTACLANGESILADVDAPDTAYCPTCGGELILRSRRLMVTGEQTYFWRHASNRNLRCQERSRPSAMSWGTMYAGAGSGE